MDTAIKDGDFQTNGSGLPVRISGARELLQAGRCSGSR